MTSRVHILWESRVPVHDILCCQTTGRFQAQPISPLALTTYKNLYSRLSNNNNRRSSEDNSPRHSVVVYSSPYCPTVQFYCFGTGLKFKAGTCKVLHMEYSSVRRWKMGPSERRSETPGKFKMRCCRRKGKISWTDRVRNEEVLHRAKKAKDVQQTIKRIED